MKKAVIFDLDGTLADTLESIAHCTNRALVDYGLRPIDDSQAFKRFVGNGAKMLIVRALRQAGDPEGERFEKPDADGFDTWPVHTEAVFARYVQYFEKGCMYRVKPYAGICEMLQKLKESGFRLAVLSNKPHENTEFVINSLFGEGYFDVVQGQTDDLGAKPAPDGVFAIIKKLALQKEDILYVGDSWVDMDTGNAAGVKTVGVLWGFRGRQELLEHGADALIERPQELLELL